MAKVNITAGTASAYGAGELQLQNKAPMDGTLRIVTDNANTASPLKLSTALVQSTSTLKITTSDVAYIDAEDNSGNNRFTVSRAVASQLVTVDFASVPTDLTTAVGAIRTATDGVNLANVMTFLENGKIGIGTSTPFGLLDVSATTPVLRILSPTNGVCTLSLADSAGNLKGGISADISSGEVKIGGLGTGGYFPTFLVSNVEAMRISTSRNVSIGTATDLSARLGIKGSGATSATTSLLVQNSAGSSAFTVKDDLTSSFTKGIEVTPSTYQGLNVGYQTQSANSFLVMREGSTTGYKIAIGTDGTGSTIFYNNVNNSSFVSGEISLTIIGATKNVLIGTTTDVSSALLNVSSTTKGFLPPRMTTVQKNAIATPAAGLMVYDTTLNKLAVYTTAWETITSI